MSNVMKRIAIITAAACFSALPVLAEESVEDNGFSLMEEGAKLLMRGLLDEMAPALDALRDTVDDMGPAFSEFAQSVGPAFADLLEQVDDLRHYEAPEIMPNGDIIMRRSPDAPVWQPGPKDTDEIEL